MTEKKILVVEDNESMLHGIQEVLEVAGYQVNTAKNGQEALECLEWFYPDLIVSDIMMPYVDGYQLFAEVRANPKWIGVPFIFLSAKDQRIDVRHGKQLGADDYLTKPFEPEDLLVAVEAKLKRVAALQSASEAEMDRLKQNILNTFSHEFRTPLTYIRGYLDLILHESPNRLSVEEVYDFLHYIRQGSERLNRLVDDFIFLVKLETGEAFATFCMERMYSTYLRSLIEVVAQQKMQLARKQGVRLELDLTQPLPGVVVHLTYFGDALGRVIENGIKFARKEGGYVLIRATADEESIYIAIQDNGIGIEAAELPNLFKRLRQINRERLEQPGIGVGLAIAKAIVEFHEGQIEVESQLGKGSTFTIVLPISAEKPA